MLLDLVHEFIIPDSEELNDCRPEANSSDKWVCFHRPWLALLLALHHFISHTPSMSWMFCLQEHIILLWSTGWNHHVRQWRKKELQYWSGILRLMVHFHRPWLALLLAPQLDGNTKCAALVHCWSHCCLHCGGLWASYYTLNHHPSISSSSLLLFHFTGCVGTHPSVLACALWFIIQI